MLAKRIIPCLDVKDGMVVKGQQFKNLEVVGDIVDLASYYSDEGADELVFYDITASAEKRVVSTDWVKRVAKKINIPFCVAGGIKTLEQAKEILYSGADKISINSPALDDPKLIFRLSEVFGSQCVVIGMDSMRQNNDFYIYKYSGSDKTRQGANLRTLDWVFQVQALGAGEIVLNCMNQDGMRSGYDIEQIKAIKEIVTIPIIASGGAGALEHFLDVFKLADADGALAASLFHKKVVRISEVKEYLKSNNIRIRL